MRNIEIHDTNEEFNRNGKIYVINVSVLLIPHFNWD